VNNRTLLFATIAILATLAMTSVVQVHAKRDPTVSGVRIGSTGGGDGDVIFTIDNSLNPNPQSTIVSIRVTLTNTDNSAIRSVNAAPTGWTASALVFQNGKAVQVTWSTTTNGVAFGHSLGGFDLKMAGSTPYNWSWGLNDQIGATFTGSFTIN
jgi:hypothetical protein